MRRALSILAIALVGLVLPAHAQDQRPAAAGNWRTLRRTADEQFRERLTALAAKCDALGLANEAKVTRDWTIPRDPGRRYVFLTPPAVDPTQPAPQADEVVQRWYAKFREHRAAQADALVEAARAALAEHQPAEAYSLLFEALRENPEHGRARHAVELPAATRSAPASKERSGSGKIESSTPRIDHPRLGWKRGQYWRAESAHVRVATNVNAAAAVDLARQLEDVCAVWRQVYFSFWSREAALAARMNGADDPLGPSRKHDVVLFRNRDEYVTRLQSGQPRIAKTTGIYLDEQRVSYLYAADETVESTWRHELAHQLFQETDETPPGVGADANMWAAEAAAIYFESLRKENGYYTIGGKDADRLQFARYRILRGDGVMPLDELSALGRDALQQHADIAKLYGQSAAVVHQLMDGRDRQFATGFVEFLRLLYAKRAGADALMQRLKVTGRELDDQLREYLQVTDDELRAWPPLDGCRNLSLGRTAVTDAGLKQLRGVQRLQWLDLSFTPATDEALVVFRDAKKLNQLFLEQTKVTDNGLELIGSFRELEELDLSRSPITDRGLAHLSNLKRLKKLYLTGCTISDAGLAPLKSLKQLDTLEVSETNITPKGLSDLKKSLPKLSP